jgi:hypothetical protein
MQRAEVVQPPQVLIPEPAVHKRDAPVLRQPFWQPNHLQLHQPVANLPALNQTSNQLMHPPVPQQLVPPVQSSAPKFLEENLRDR